MIWLRDGYEIDTKDTISSYIKEREIRKNFSFYNLPIEKPLKRRVSENMDESSPASWPLKKNNRLRNIKMSGS